MILNNPENRRLINTYLEVVDEDTFISDFITPFFSEQGYYLLRVNSHGPSEHGKDLIFYRHVPMFYDFEYVAVQAKAEHVTTKNNATISHQLKRAYGTSFPTRGSDNKAYPHYAVLVNARKHANEANEELYDMLRELRHVKILAQEQVCELIIKSGIAPLSLIKRLSTSAPSSSSTEDKEVYECLMKNDPKSVEDLLDHRMTLIQRHISRATKELVIDFIYQRWMKDRSWDGTVKPMKWLNTYFDFMSGSQHSYLLAVFEELTSSYPSRAALSDTKSVVHKTTPEILNTIAADFIKYCAELSLSGERNNREIPLSKLRDLHKANIVINTAQKTLMQAVIDYENARAAGDKAQRRSTHEALQKMTFPQLYE